MTSDAVVRLKDMKARKGHLCLGGVVGSDGRLFCGCGTVLDDIPDFLDLPVDQQRRFAGDPHGRKAAEWGWAPTAEVTGAVQPPVTVSAEPNGEPPLVSGDDVPPPPFTHANGEPCYGCQSCFAVVADHLDEDDPAFQDPGPLVDVTPFGEADVVEAAGREVAERHGAPDMNPAVPVIDPTKPYGPAEVERAILDANRRLELGLKHEANLIAATEQLKIDYELAYARAIDRSTGGAADQRKANAVLASEREYRAWHEAMAARDAMKSITHTLRSTISALQSVSRSVGTSYSTPQGSGR